MEEAATTGEANQPGSGRVGRYFNGDHVPDEKRGHVPSLPFRKEGRFCILISLANFNDTKKHPAKPWLYTCPGIHPFFPGVKTANAEQGAVCQ
jgi:hypothetical protein